MLEADPTLNVAVRNSIIYIVCMCGLIIAAMNRWGKH